MARYAARRCLEAIPTLFFVSIIVFALIRMAPGDPAAMKMGREAAREENKPKLEALRHEMGLDRPIPVQYLLWLQDLSQGEFGDSVRSKRPTFDLFMQKLPATLELVFARVAVCVLRQLSHGDPGGGPARDHRRPGCRRVRQRGACGAELLVWAGLDPGLQRQTEVAAGVWIRALQRRPGREHQAIADARGHARPLSLRDADALLAGRSYRRAGGRLRPHRPSERAARARRDRQARAFATP